MSATDIADHHAPNLKNLTKEDADCYKELSQPVDNGKFSASEKRVNTYSSVMSVQADAPPVKQTAVPISSEEVSKKSFAAIVSSYLLVACKKYDYSFANVIYFFIVND